MTRTGSFDVLTTDGDRVTRWTHAWISRLVVELPCGPGVIRVRIVSVEPAVDSDGSEVSGMFTVSWEGVA